MPKNKILVIDDESEIIDMLTVVLKARNYTVISALDGQRGIERVKKDRPDLILLDILMPGTDGYSVCTKLKTDKETKNIPVIILSGMDEREAIIKCHNLGADDYIVKPFNLTTLLTKIRKFTNGK